MIKKIIFVLLLSFFLCVSIFSQGAKNYEFAGSFYPKVKEKLAEMIDSFITKAPFSSTEGEIIGIISPHAGYIYSGEVAGCSYKILKENNIKNITVIILSPTHHYYFKGVSIYSNGSFDTPFGKIEIDEDIARKLESVECVNPVPEVFYGEHSIEVQLPFLKKVVPQCKIVPLLFGKIELKEMENLAHYFVDLYKKKKFILIVSTDLSHYHPYSEARSIDLETISHIEKLDYIWLWESVLNNKMRACGILPLITFLSYVKEVKGNIKIVKYANSGDTKGGKDKVVGYLSAVAYLSSFLKKEEAMGLTKEEKKTLLNIARKTLESYLSSNKAPEFKIDSERLNQKRMVFVTLKKHGELRGCIGRVVADTPLYKAVSKVAIDSALHDSRFVPVRYEELSDIEIEISVMTPFEEVKDLSDIKVGRDGLMIRKGFYSGLLLPQVPTEYGWDRKTFLEHLCYKAGLYKDAYKEPGAVIYKFSAEVFSEGEFND